MRFKLSYTLTALSIFIDAAGAQECSPGLTGSASASDPFWMANPGLHVEGKSAYNLGSRCSAMSKRHTVLLEMELRMTPLLSTEPLVMVAAADQDANLLLSRLQLYTSPPANTRVTKPIVPYYFTSLVGDAKNKPILIADANFVGVAVIDANPYVDGAQNPDGTGVNWWLNQNNFFRSVRNFVIDVRAMSPDKVATGIHWQVGQATSLINIDFKMVRATDIPSTKHQGLFAENGSGGFMSDLTFDGGAFGMWISNQQFTIRNVKITNAATAIYEQWNWGFTWQNIDISNCLVGFDLHTGGLTLDTQSAGGVLIVDSWIKNVLVGVRMSTNQTNSLAGSVILDNVQFSNIFSANIQDKNGVVLAASSAAIPQWFQGNVYLGLTKTYTRGALATTGNRPTNLINAFGAYFSKSRPQYQDYRDIQVLNIMSLGSLGAAGDGVKDDTVALNTFLSKYSGCAILFIDAGTYLVTDTIFVPPGTILVGQMFSVIMGSGPKFADQKNPRPLVQVGNPGDTGAVEISDMVISTTGGSAGAIGIQWNIKTSSQGAAGMWDVHVRLGGTKGTNINAANCPTSSKDTSKCASAFLGFHITSSGSGYFENVWVWNADHDLDDPAETKLNVYSGRGVLVESTGPVWLVGTASEHHVIYQYAFNKARNIWAGLIQTETLYFQPTPSTFIPFSINPTYGDPPGPIRNAWGLVITLSSNIFVYGGGLYSFFQTYSQACVPSRNCQDSMVLVDRKSASLFLYQITTAGSTNMISYANASIAKQADNINGFASTLTFWEAPLTVPQGTCGIATRQIDPYDDSDIAARQFNPKFPPQNYDYFTSNPSRIDVELMVGALDEGTGLRARRQNCVFYVNQQEMEDSNPDLGRRRAIEFAALMNAAHPVTSTPFVTPAAPFAEAGINPVFVDDVYDNAAAFTDTEDPMRSANAGGWRRDWFRITSAHFAMLCTGTVYLIVEDLPRERSHELRHLGVNPTILEVRPRDVGTAVSGINDIRTIPVHRYRGDPPSDPNTTPPRDEDAVIIDECAQIDPDASVSKWAAFPDVGGDVAPFKEGTCSMHIKQYSGGVIFENPNPLLPYSVEVTIFDNLNTHKIGVLAKTDTPVDMKSKLDSLFTIKVVTDGDYLQFTLGSLQFRSNDGSCNVGGWDRGQNRQMDCGFPCVWGGEDSTDRSIFGLFYA
ncbi:pectate lyase superfamily protein-domain-containing protein [Mycena rebaudengoi]|nr:pectate lyase superfamily protein-domain-containing protein [Mycena rebaudengoi]